MADNRWLVRSLLTIGLILLGLPAVATAQEAPTVSGQVKTSVGGAPLAGVIVSVPSLRLTVQTDNDGRYRLVVPAGTTGPVTLTAEVYAYDASVRAAYLDSTRGYFNGPSIFVWPVGHEHEPCEVDIVAPDGGACSGWRVATTLRSAGAAPYGFGRYCASDYDELIDHPVEMGTFLLGHFEAGDVPHDFAITGGRRFDSTTTSLSPSPITSFVPETIRLAFPIALQTSPPALRRFRLARRESRR